MGKVANCAIFLADTDGVGHERVAVAGEWQMFPSIDSGPDTPPDLPVLGNPSGGYHLMIAIIFDVVYDCRPRA